MFDSVHSLIHPGTGATTRMISCRFVWSRLAVDVKEWCRECSACQRAKVTCQPNTPVEKMEIPKQRFSLCMWTWWDPCPRHVLCMATGTCLQLLTGAPGDSRPSH